VGRYFQDLNIGFYSDLKTFLFTAHHVWRLLHFKPSNTEIQCAGSEPQHSTSSNWLFQEVNDNQVILSEYFNVHWVIRTASMATTSSSKSGADAFKKFITKAKPLTETILIIHSIDRSSHFATITSFQKIIQILKHDKVTINCIIPQLEKTILGRIDEITARKFKKRIW